MSETMTVLLGGYASPIGMCVQYIHADAESALADLVRWRKGLGQEIETIDAGSFPLSLKSLEPLEWNWTKELVMPCGDEWTAYLNSRTDGGDPSASARVVARNLNVLHVVAINTLRREPGHQSTQLRISSSHGSRDRSIAAYCADGRWGWDEVGSPYPFEQVERYDARLKKARFDRPLLLDYLEAMGIPVTDDAFGSGVVVRQINKARS